MKIAFHKGSKLLGDKLIRWWDDGPYSHCEVVFSDGLWASASFMDNLCVRGKHINPSPANWDYLHIPDKYEQPARQFLAETDGMKYDVLGLVRFIVAPMRGVSDKYWCSEWVAEALGLEDPWRYGPNGLYAALKLIEIKGENDAGAS